MRYQVKFREDALKEWQKLENHGSLAAANRGVAEYELSE